MSSNNAKGELSSLTSEENCNDSIDEEGSGSDSESYEICRVATFSEEFTSPLAPTEDRGARRKRFYRPSAEQELSKRERSDSTVCEAGSNSGAEDNITYEEMKEDGSCAYEEEEEEAVQARSVSPLPSKSERIKQTVLEDIYKRRCVYGRSAVPIVDESRHKFNPSAEELLQEGRLRFNIV